MVGLPRHLMRLVQIQFRIASEAARPQRGEGGELVGDSTGLGRERIRLERAACGGSGACRGSNASGRSSGLVDGAG